MQAMDLSGIWVPLVTPFDGGEVDTRALARLTAHCAAAGVAGFVACGSTGEASSLDDEETSAVLATVRQAAADRPVLLGLTGAHAGQLQARLQRFAGEGADGFLISAPPYVRPSQPALVDWFTALADRSPVPLVLYDIPYRTGVQLALQTLRTLAEHPCIIGLKDCGGDAAKTRTLIAEGRLQVLAGEDAQVFTSLCWGAAGAIAATAQAWPQVFVALYEAVQRQQLHAARALAHRLAPAVELAFAEPNPAPLKGLLARQGWLREELRAPHRPASADVVDRLMAVQAGWP